MIFGKLHGAILKLAGLSVNMLMPLVRYIKYPERSQMT
jgi:hypothetical protein